LAPRKRPTADAAGFTAIEALFVVALSVTVGGISLPPLLNVADDVRAVAATRYVAARLQRARMEAVLRSTNVALRFSPSGGRVSFATYVDGNRNGVLSADILLGVDARLGPVDALADHFRGVEFGALPGVPAVDPGGTAPGSDPIRLGSSDGATFSADGTSSTGSVYVLGAGSRQFVVRIYGDTGKTRILKFDGRTRVWRPL
jgi:type II secretory pathway pseudopilin PulG